MSRLWPKGEFISVRTDELGRPLKFSWRNRIYSVERIQEHWQVDTDWWSDAGRVWREYVTCTTTSGLLCVLYQDLLSENWYLSKLYD